MDIVTQIFVIISVLLFNLYIIHILRKELIEYQYALMWLVSGFLMLVFAIFPGLLATLSKLLGIGIPLNLVYFAVILMGFVFTFQIIINISKMRKSNYELVQELSILKKQVLN